MSTAARWSALLTTTHLMAFRCSRLMGKSSSLLRTATARSRATPIFLLPIGWNEFTQKSSLVGKERKELELAVKPIPEGLPLSNALLDHQGRGRESSFIKKHLAPSSYFAFLRRTERSVTLK